MINDQLRKEVIRLRETLKITDEMVKRAAEACYLASYEEPTATRSWDDLCEEYPDAAALYLWDARVALEAALEKEK